MTKELFVSSTPHETKVGMVEDDLLAEIYLERENEYTLAGSIYKGRVTRVLPGMQSAFVDIGLERDAFLYVSDFMELEDSEDLDEVPTNRPAPERYQPQPQAEAHAGGNLGVRIRAAESQPQEPAEAGAENHERACIRRVAMIVAAFGDGGVAGGVAGSACRIRRFAGPAAETPREASRTERPERVERPERSERPQYSSQFSERQRTIRASGENGPVRAFRIRSATGIPAHHSAGRIDLEVSRDGADSACTGQRTA